MKNFRLFLLVISVVMIAGITGCKSKADTWTRQDKESWKSNCLKFMTERGVAKASAEDFCDCMLKKTSAKYTPGEAKKITASEELRLWQECDYSW